MDFHSFDADYLRRLTAGDQETERHFASYFGDLLLIKLRFHLRDPDEVNDVRQATFAKVYEKLRTEGVRQPDRFGAFVCGVCDNMAREHIRRRSRVDQFPEDGPEVPDSRVNIESELVSDEKKRLVRDVLEELSARDRELIQAVFVLERDKDDVCRQFGVDREYLRVLLHRAKERIRKRLAKQQSTGK